MIGRSEVAKDKHDHATFIWHLISLEQCEAYFDRFTSITSRERKLRASQLTQEDVVPKSGLETL